MAHLQSLVLYTAPSSPSSLSTIRASGPLLSLGVFTAQTGTAIATELLYRILVDLINRLVHSLHRFAANRIDDLSSYLERVQQRRGEAGAAKHGEEGLGIVREVGKAAEERGFVCRLGMAAEEEGGMPAEWVKRRGAPEPPRWVRSVLKGVDEGRMQERDFWIHTHTG